jgi:hypothetical protein
MRKAIVVVIGCILLCGLLVAAMVPRAESAPTVTVTINGNTKTDGVDQPWFELSRGRSETVQWHNVTGSKCTLTVSGGPPFPHRIVILNGEYSDVFSAADAPGPPFPDWPEGKVYKVYHYSIDIEGGNLIESPGGGIKR